MAFSLCGSDKLLNRDVEHPALARSGAQHPWAKNLHQPPRWLDAWGNPQLRCWSCARELGCVSASGSASLPERRGACWWPWHRCQQQTSNSLAGDFEIGMKDGISVLPCLLPRLLLVNKSILNQLVISNSAPIIYIPKKTVNRSFLMFFLVNRLCCNFIS